MSKARRARQLLQQTDEQGSMPGSCSSRRMADASRANIRLSSANSASDALGGAGAGAAAGAAAGASAGEGAGAAAAAARQAGSQAQGYMYMELVTA